LQGREKYGIVFIISAKPVRNGPADLSRIPYNGKMGECKMKKVAIVIGSDSDYPVMQAAAARLDFFGIPYEVRLLSAHRTPAEAAQFAESAAADGFGVLIAAAGKAAHLAGALAARSPLPVIGVPIKSSTLDGLDSLLSTVQMPRGVPVATVAIDGAENAAILAAQILALSDGALAEKVEKFRNAQREKALEKGRALQEKLHASRS
jgi:5-(carboxyamino)imidazole ribonucleotide mutase